MNIVYIHSHDTGRYIQPYGFAAPTPHLMKLANEGIIFRHAYCAGPTCSPSRAAQFTGMAPHSSGMIGLAHRGFEMDDYQLHLVEFLNHHGYETALAGIQHEATEIDRIGYQQVLGESEVNMDNFELDSVSWDQTNAQAAADYIHGKKGSDRPFFLSFGMFNTHLNFPAASDEFNPNYLVPPHPFHDNRQTREMMASYMTSVKVMDECAGMVLQAIEEAGIRQNTLVIYTTDHGLPFPKMKCSLYDTGIGVSLIMRTPDQLRRGEAEDALVSQVDLFPTICDMAGLDIPERVHGHSLSPLLKKETDRIRDEIFAEVTYHAGYEPMRCIRTERYKYIKYYEHRKYVPANWDQSAMRSFVVDHGALQDPHPQEMLFDLYLDPVERVNLIDDASSWSIREDLSGRLNSWMVKTDDPMLKGAVPPPQGAIVSS